MAAAPHAELQLLDHRGQVLRLQSAGVIVTTQPPLSPDALADFLHRIQTGVPWVTHQRLRSDGRNVKPRILSVRHPVPAGDAANAHGAGAGQRGRLWGASGGAERGRVDRLPGRALDGHRTTRDAVSSPR